MSIGPTSREGADHRAPFEVLSEVRILPVVTITQAAVAPALVAALAAGGCRMVEITLRTPAALDAIARASSEVPEAIVGAGTVTSVAMLHAAVGAGARFAVSPGFDPRVVDAAREAGVAMLPGVATPTELMLAVERGVGMVKVFPAGPLGGPAMVAALAAVWPEVGFVPTGGISFETAPSYLRHEQVVAVGGSWMAPDDAIGQRAWATVTATAAEAVAMASRAVSAR